GPRPSGSGVQWRKFSNVQLRKRPTWEELQPLPRWDALSGRSCARFDPRQAEPGAVTQPRRALSMINGAGCALDGSVLVLNKFFMAVHVISVRRAFRLLFKELAEVITIDDGQYVAFNFTSWREASQARSQFKGPDDEFIRTVHFEIEVPRIIRLLACDRLPRQKVKFNRRNIFARDGNRCQYCGRKFATT